jgi:hypothetical protein
LKYILPKIDEVMVMRKLIILTLLLVSGLLVLVPDASAQGVSEIDTLMFDTAYALPGDTVAVPVILINESFEVATWNLQYRFDTTVIKPIVVADADNLYPVYDLTGPMIDWVPFGAIGSGLYYFPASLLGALVTGIFPGDPDQPVTAPTGGPWHIMNIYFEIQPDVALETVTTIDLFSDFSTSGGIIITISDVTGLEIVEPTLIDGTIIVKDTSVGPEPNAPAFDPLTSPITVGEGSRVTFAVSASDPDGDSVTLSATNLPSGATFPTVKGDGAAASTFTWPSAQAGNWSVTFRAQDNTGLTTTRSVSIIVEEIVTDEIYVGSSEGLGTRGGIAGTPEVAVPIELRDVQTIFGIQFDLEYDYSICRLDSITQTDRLPGFSVYDNSIESGLIRIVAFGTENESIVDGTEGNTIMYLWMTINATAVPGNYPLTILNAYESINPDPGVNSIPLEYRSDGVIAVDMFGDVNLHPPVDVADLVSLVGYIIGDWDLTERQFRAANVNSDTEANVIDLVAILNYVLGITSAPQPTNSYNGPDAIVNSDIGDIDAGQAGFMRIDADLPADVGGVQLEINYDPEKVKLDKPVLSERTGDLYLRYSNKGNGRMVVLMHYRSGSTNPVAAGLGEILSIPVQAINDIQAGGNNSDLRLDNVVLSSPEGANIPVKGYGPAPVPTRFSLSQNYPNPFNPRTNIVFEVMSTPNNPGGADVELVVYNILGQKVKSLASGYYAPGEYTVVWEGTDDYGDKQASGVYFYSLISGDSRTTKKMVLAK